MKNGYKSATLFGIKKSHRFFGDDDSPELKAIAEITKQVENFTTLLGEAAKADEIEALKKEIELLQKGINTLTGAEVLKSIEAINKGNASLQKQIIELQEEANKAKENETKENRKTLKLVSTEEIEKFIESTFKGAVKSDTGKYLGGQKTASGDENKITIKAPETFGYPNFFAGAGGTDITAFTGRVIDPTLYKRKRKRNLILDNFDIQTINVPTLVYLQKVEIGDTNPTSGDPGHADWILSGASKPQRSFRVTSGTVDAKKVAIYGNVEDKLLRDVSSLENWIREDFMLEMSEKINDGLLNNNPAVNANAPLGLKTNAVQFTATPAFALSVTDVTYIDALIAVFAFFVYNREEAQMAFVSSDIWYRIQSLKDSQARYLNNPLIYTNAMGELYIAGIHIIWADQLDVPADHLLVVGVDLGFKIKAYNAMVFERGLNGNDFREDKTSYRGYQEFLTYFPSNRYNSVLYDTWANIFAAIAKP